ncbi:DnaJ domain-containing protein, partial [Lasiosphaeria hispida]
YKLLKVPPTASSADIAKAYKRLSLIYHPDKLTGSTEAFQQLGQAYDVLRDSNLRALYN